MGDSYSSGFCLKSNATEKRMKNVECGEEEKLPYVHVRARRGQATDSHSLAERVVD